MNAVKRNLIYQTMRAELLNGQYPAGAKLPGELKLKKRFGVARETVRGALKMLQNEHMLVRAPGLGTHVRYCGNGNTAGRMLFITQTPQSIWTKLLECKIPISHCLLKQFSGMSVAAIDRFLAEERISFIAIRGSFAYTTEKPLEVLKQTAVPSALVLAEKECLHDNNMAGIAYDLKSAWGNALEYLAKRGHRRVATASAAASGKIRRHSPEEYRRLFFRLGLEFDPELLMYSLPAAETRLAGNGKFSEAVAAEIERMLALPKPPTAFICNTDQWAVTVYEVLRRHKLRIPDDVAVMGFVDSGFDENSVSPKLSTVSIDLKELTDQMVELVKSAPRWHHADGEKPILQASLRINIKQST